MSTFFISVIKHSKPPSKVLIVNPPLDRKMKYRYGVLSMHQEDPLEVRNSNPTSDFALKIP